jgi:hypothetical protein
MLIIQEVHIFVAGTSKEDDCIKNIPMENWKFSLAIGDSWTSGI